MNNRKSILIISTIPQMNIICFLNFSIISILIIFLKNILNSPNLFTISQKSFINNNPIIWSWAIRISKRAQIVIIIKLIIIFHIQILTNVNIFRSISIIFCINYLLKKGIFFFYFFVFIPQHTYYNFVIIRNFKTIKMKKLYFQIKVFSMNSMFRRSSKSNII